MVGYHGESFRFSIHRKSGTNGTNTQTGLPSRAGEMHHRGVGGDDHIEILDQRRRLGEIVKLRGKVHDRKRRRRGLRGGLPFLQD